MRDKYQINGCSMVIVEHRFWQKGRYYLRARYDRDIINGDVPFGLSRSKRADEQTVLAWTVLTSRLMRLQCGFYTHDALVSY